jgi:hypothetical protein
VAIIVADSNSQKKEVGNVGRNAKRFVLIKVRPASLRADPSRDRLRKEKSLNVEVRPLTTSSDSRAPIKIVDGCPWSPGMYPLLCLLGKP